jgi:hypothetical protein
MKIAAIVREILSEPGPGGTLSWGRVAATVSLLTGIVWVTKIVLHTHTLPDLMGVSGFVTAPYAVAKASAAAQSFSNNPVTAVQQNQVIPHA